VIRVAVAVAAVAAALAATAGAASAGGPRMAVGAVEPEILQPTLEQAQTMVDQAFQAGLAGALRVQLTWARGITAPQPETVTSLQNAVAAAASRGAALYVSLYPYGSSQTPLADLDQEQFAQWAAAIAKAVPAEHHYIIGNEPNLNRFWLPQFGADGGDVAASGYVSLLGRTYDALKAVDPSIQVLGGALSHAGVDKPNTGRDTHSPTQFILDMGAAYRASGRTAPIMDALTFHPYMLASDEPPTLQHPTSTTITIADYDKLVATLGQAFDGTSQQGSQLPIVFDEYGVESQIPPEKASLYTGAEPSTIHPVDEATQAAYYAGAFQLAFCQPNVKAILVFSLVDEVNRAGWQSGVYYADRTPKSSLPVVRAAASRVRRNVIASCDGLQVTPRPRVSFFPEGRPTGEASTFPVAVTCDVDCRYRLRLVKVSTGSTTLSTSGRLVGGFGKRLSFRTTRPATGRYRLELTAEATMNVGPPATVSSPVFTIPSR